MKYFIISILALYLMQGCNSFQQKNGKYIYDVAFAEWQGKSVGAKVEIEIKEDSIIVRNHEGLSGKKGEIIDKGIIIQHTNGKWIIAHSPKDKYNREIGGCSGGPAIIDFKNKKFWLC